jgi:hypothetical protein
MSIEMMTLVWRHSRNKGGVLLMQLAIADHAHDDGTGAFPSVARLTRYARQSERNVQYLLRKLIGSKEVSVQPNAGPHGTNIFTINVRLLKRLPDVIEGGAKIAPVQSFAPVKKVAPVKKLARGVQSSAPGVQKRAKGVQKLVKHRVQPVAPKPEPSIEPSVQNHQQPHGAVADLPNFDFCFSCLTDMRVDADNAEKLLALLHVTETYILAWHKIAKENHARFPDGDKRRLGGGYFYARMRDQKVPPDWSSVQQAQWRREQHARIANA